MAAISTRQPAIEITYATAKGRRTKKFSGEELGEARTFYAKKLEAGADPQITGEKPANWDAPAADAETQELTDAVNAAIAAIAANPAPAKIRLGVAPTAKTRAYFAGKIIAEFGHDKGVTPEMVKALDKAYGKANPTESEIMLRNAWHALRGFGLPTAPAAQ